MGPRFAGVTCTVTSGVGSFSDELQPFRMIAPARSSTLRARSRDFAALTLRSAWFMELSAPLSMSGDSRARRDNGRLRPDKRHLRPRKWFARRPLQARWLRRL